jgi:hypothetical protein
LDITATFYRSLPFDAQAYERAYELFDKAVWFQPKKFGEYEPLKTKWGNKKEFTNLCHENSRLHFSSIIIEGVRNKRYAMLVPNQASAERLWAGFAGNDF